MSLPANKHRPTRRIYVSVYEDSYERLVKELCAGERGISSDVLRTLLDAFVLFLDERNTPNYIESNGTSLNTIKRLLSVIKCTVGH